MAKHYYKPELSVAERLEYLQSAAANVRVSTHYRDLTDDEKSKVKDDHMKNSDELEKLTEQLKGIVASYKEKIDALKEENSGLLEAYRIGRAEIEETVYDLDDYENGVMRTYNEHGEMLEIRRLEASERQTSLPDKGHMYAVGE